MSKKTNFQRFSAIVSGKEYSFNAWTTSTRNGSCHVVESVDYPTTKTRITWEGRTWESFRYEKVLRRAIKKLPAEIQPGLLAQIVDKTERAEREKAGVQFDQFKALHGSLNDENKKRLQSLPPVQTEDQARAVMGYMGFLALMQ